MDFYPVASNKESLGFDMLLDTCLNYRQPRWIVGPGVNRDMGSQFPIPNMDSPDSPRLSRFIPVIVISVFRGAI